MVQFENSAFITVAGRLPRTRIPVLMDGWSPKLLKIRDDESVTDSKHKNEVEPAGVGQPATKPAVRPAVKDQPSTPTPKDDPR